MEAKLKTLRKTLKTLPFAIIRGWSCSICPSCTYPDNPCRKPEEATPSMEAVGIDVYNWPPRPGLNITTVQVP